MSDSSAGYVGPVRIIRSPKLLSATCRAAVRPVVIVPTMGALHAGHAALIQHARRIAGKSGTVVVSIFVNPTQFGKGEDLARYPRPFRRDAKLCAENSVDLLFHPSSEAMYGGEFSTFVEEITLSKELCGRSRPHHFRGVATVVMKLFNLVRPDVAVFGRKDFQQLAIIRRMIADLNLSVRIAELPTVREPDGLALSSRNSYLSKAERAQAPLLWKSLREAARTARNGERRASALRRIVERTLQNAPDGKSDYIEVVNVKNLRPIAKLRGRCAIALAVFFGKTRLIDHIEISA
jgi:pantoate--beta-alanine ligase